MPPSPVKTATFTCIALMLHVFVAVAAWGPDGATIKSTTAVLPQVVACNDGGTGALVVWAEPLGGQPYELRAQHMFSTGDVDGGLPAAGAVLCTLSTVPTDLRMLSDGAGGAYLWWMNGTDVRLLRMTPNGGLAAGWPPAGRQLTVLSAAMDRVDLVVDGAGGVFAAWSTSCCVYLTHVGGDNVGWAVPRSVSSAPAFSAFPKWAQLSLAPDGDVFVAWARSSADTMVAPAGWRLKRMTALGLTAAGWPSDGIEIRSMEDPVNATAGTWPRLDMTPDGVGGVYVFLVNQRSSDPFDMDARVYQIQGDGSPAPQWPAAGQYVANVYVAMDVGPAAAARVHAVSSGVAVGVAQHSVHSPGFVLAHVQSGQPGFAGGGVNTASQIESIESGGNMFLAAVVPSGPYQPYSPPAFMQVMACPGAPGWTTWGEYHFEPVLQWYGDIALAPTGDGGAYFFWSQHREKFGLFARRFNASGQVVSVSPSGNPPRLKARFTTGDGVRLAGSLGADGPAHIELFDLAGRRISAMRVSAGPFDVLLPATERLATGLYFARATGQASQVFARVVVTH